MAIRCEECRKFVSLEEESVETSLEIEGGSITGTVELQMACGECGTTLRSFSFDVSHELEDQLTAVDGKPTPGEDCLEEKEGHGLEVEGEAVYEFTRRKQRPKNRHGYSLDVTVTCECGAAGTLNLKDDVSAEEMDEA